MHLSLMVMEMVEEKIRAQGNQKIQKITKYPDTEEMEPPSVGKSPESLFMKTSFCNPGFSLPKPLSVSFDEPEPQPKPLPNCPSLDVSLGKERGPEPPIKPNSPDSFRMKVVDHLTIHTPPSPHMASFYPRDVYCYYHTRLDDPKKHYGFKLGLLGQSGSLGVNFLDLEVIDNDLLGEGYSLPLGPRALEKGRIKETHHLEHEIFDEKKPESSYEFQVDNSWMTI
ncbi:hypothetical protein Tco_1368942 [Tanacetum coccineum]